MNPDNYYPSAPWLACNGHPGRPPKTAPTLAQVEDVFARWLYVPDPAPLRAVLAVTVTHFLADRRPVWLLLEGPTSIGKTVYAETLGQVPVVATKSVLNRAGSSPRPRPRRAGRYTPTDCSAPPSRGASQTPAVTCGPGRGGRPSWSWASWPP